jgi:hypothetical protein
MVDISVGVDLLSCFVKRLELAAPTILSLSLEKQLQGEGLALGSR